MTRGQTVLAEAEPLLAHVLLAAKRERINTTTRAPLTSPACEIPVLVLQPTLRRPRPTRTALQRHRPLMQPKTLKFPH